MTEQLAESDWAARADQAERAVITRHLTPVWKLPWTRLGISAHPATRDQRLLRGVWNYWWQAHLLDAAVDAYERDPSPAHRTLVRRLVRGHRLRNGNGVITEYYDDMAWLALALRRAEQVVGVDTASMQRTLAGQFLYAWDPDAGGGIPWRKGGEPFFNAPANGPAGIFLARFGDVERATRTADWLFARLWDPASGLIMDGVDATPPYGSGELHPQLYTYCQGVTIGLETELAAHDPRHGERAAELIAAVRSRMTDGDVITGGGGGDGGLFNGILVRNLALAARALGPEHTAAREAARAMVLATAQAAWRNAVPGLGGPLFGPDYTRPAHTPSADGAASRFVGGAVQAGDQPERDLSVQVGGWMVIEAAAALSR